MGAPQFHFCQGDGPLLVSMPHGGTHIGTEILPHLTEEGRAVKDTDWHLDVLYDFLAEEGISSLRAHHSRTVIDLNRDSGGAALYPGKSETELCPTTSFGYQPLYMPGQAPDEDEIKRRKETYWQPYHDKLRTELARIKAKFGYALLWDAHSIQSRVERFFDGQLPDLNIGTGNGTTCDQGLADRLYQAAEASDYSVVINGRFKGGFITRNYGAPADQIHAVQLEISQITYMDEEPTFAFDEQRAKKLRPVLKDMLRLMTDFKPVCGG